MLTEEPGGERWYVVHTQPNGEARALDHLRRQGFHVYLPLIRKRRRHARKEEIVERPLFPRYLFVRLDIGRDAWRSILSTMGVATLIRFGEHPAPLPQGVVRALRVRQEAGLLAEPALVDQLRPGDCVTLHDDPYGDMIAQFVRLIDRERIIVLLDMMGRAVPATISASSVSSVAPAAPR